MFSRPKPWMRVRGPARPTFLRECCSKTSTCPLSTTKTRKFIAKEPLRCKNTYVLNIAFCRCKTSTFFRDDVFVEAKRAFSKPPEPPPSGMDAQKPRTFDAHHPRFQLACPRSLRQSPLSRIRRSKRPECERGAQPKHPTSTPIEDSPLEAPRMRAWCLGERSYLFKMRTLGIFSS